MQENEIVDTSGEDATEDTATVVEDTTSPVDNVSDGSIELILTDLLLLMQSLGADIDTLDSLNLTGNFQYLSKKARNDRLDKLVSDAGLVEDLVKETVRRFKKVKRIRPSDDIIDANLIEVSNVYNESY